MSEGAGHEERQVVVITGGAGFAGSTLAIYLCARGYEVYCFDNLKRRGSETNLPRLKAAGAVFVHGDIRNQEDFLELPGKAHFVVEASAEPSVLAGLGDSTSVDYLINTNLGGSLHCFSYAKRAGAKVVFLSTSRVYPIGPLTAAAYREDATRFTLLSEQPLVGFSEKGVAENFGLEGARSLYGATKLASELFLPEFKTFLNVPYVINRFGVLAGPGQFGKVDQGVTVLWVARHYFASRPLSYIGFGGSGKQVRDLLHVDDFCRAVEWQLQHFEVVDGHLFNIGGGRECSVSLLELTQLCEQVTGNKLDIAAVPETRPADIPIYLSDYSKFAAVSGWKPLKTPRDIVTDIYEWIKREEATLKNILQ